MPRRASITSNCVRSVKAVSAGPRCAVKDTTATARVIPAAATNQRCRWSRPIRSLILWRHFADRSKVSEGEVTLVTPSLRYKMIPGAFRPGLPGDHYGISYHSFSPPPPDCGVAQYGRGDPTLAGRLCLS